MLHYIIEFKSREGKFQIKVIAEASIFIASNFSNYTSLEFIKHSNLLGRVRGANYENLVGYKFPLKLNF